MSTNKLIDMTGKTFGNWTVLGRGDNTKTGQAKWICRCNCGTVKEVSGANLRQGLTTSCGCISSKKLVERNTKHNSAKRGKTERLYRVWRGMIGRCTDVKNISYKWYGALGVRVCTEWKNDYSAFKEWALQNGYDEKMPRCECTLDRIDPTGNYEPNNCRWVDMQVQRRNQRRMYAANSV